MVMVSSYLLHCEFDAASLATCHIVPQVQCLYVYNMSCKVKHETVLWHVATDDMYTNTIM